MRQIYLNLPAPIHEAMWRHLLPRRQRLEAAAFLYARQGSNGQEAVLECLEWFPVPPAGFSYRSEFHFELSDEVRASVIKRAHDLGASLVEFHSHTGPWPAKFSPTDLMGFAEFVPHVWWRLKGRPYLAVVVARRGFDGFAWIADPQKPERLTGIVVDGKFLAPTGLSPLEKESSHDW